MDIKEVSNVFSGFMFAMDSLVDANEDYDKGLERLMESRTTKRVKCINKLTRLVEECVEIYADNKFELANIKDEERRDAYNDFLESLKEVKSIVSDVNKCWDDNDSIQAVKKEIDGIYSSLMLKLADIESKESLGLRSI